MLSNLKLFYKLIKKLEIKNIQIFFLFLISLISAYMSIMCNITLKPLINEVVFYKLNSDYKYMKIFLFFTILFIITTFLRKLFFSIINIKIEEKLNLKVSDAISKADMNYFDTKKEGEIASNLTNRISDLKVFFDNSFEKIVFIPMKFFLTMIGLLYIDYEIAIIVIPGVIISTIVDFKYGNKIIASSKEVFKIENDIYGYQKEVIENIDNIKMLKNGEYILEKYNLKIKEYIKKGNKMLKDYQIAYIPSLLNEYLPTILLLIVAVFKVGKNEMNYGSFFASLSLITGVSLPLAHFLRIITRVKAESEKINTILNLLEIKENENTGSNKKIIYLSIKVMKLYL